jgi:hypothetical protein
MARAIAPGLVTADVHPHQSHTAISLDPRGGRQQPAGATVTTQ